VPVQIEGNVVGSDHDSVVRAVEEIGVERRVGRDRVAAAHGASQRMTAAEDRDSHHERTDQSE
jgi:hypothetical protein